MTAGNEAAGGGAFWEAVTSGAIRLEPHEDRMIWVMRTRNRPWARIAARILEMRAVGSQASKRGGAQMLRAYRRARLAAAVKNMMRGKA
jgi:hypothetical protein